MDAIQVVDPAVSRAKFDREVARFRKNETHFRRRGALLLRADFPVVMLAIGVPKGMPFPAFFGVRIDFTNYDVWAPSVVLVHPLTEEPYRAKEIAHVFQFLRKTGPTQATGILQSDGPESIPFLCLPGIREYHDNPAHKDNPWLMHRGTAAGTLHNLLEQILRYGTEYIDTSQQLFHINFGRVSA